MTLTVDAAGAAFDSSTTTVSVKRLAAVLKHLFVTGSHYKFNSFIIPLPRIGGYPFIAPLVIPEYICFWHKINTIKAGIIEIITPAQIKLYLLPKGPVKV